MEIQFQGKTIDTFEEGGLWYARVRETGRASGFGHHTEQAAAEEMKQWIRRNPDDRLVEP